MRDRHFARAETFNAPALYAINFIFQLSAKSAAATVILNFARQSFGATSLIFILFLFAHSTAGYVWCGRRDLNPHTSQYQNLNLARLPIRHARMKLIGRSIAGDKLKRQTLKA